MDVLARVSLLIYAKFMLAKLFGKVVGNTFENQVLSEPKCQG